MDDSKIDDDLGKLLQHIKEDQQIVMVCLFLLKIGIYLLKTILIYLLFTP